MSEKLAGDLIAQLERLVDAGGGARGDSRPEDTPILGLESHLDGGLAAGVVDLVGGEAGNLSCSNHYGAGRAPDRGRFYFMQRRDARLRKEYLYRKSLEEKEKRQHEQKQRLKSSLDASQPIPSDLKKDAVVLAKQLVYDEGMAGSLVCAGSGP